MPILILSHGKMKLVNLMYCIFSNQFISKMALDLSFLARQNPLPCPATYIVYFILFCYQILDPILIHLSMLDWPYIINKKQINLIIQDQQKRLRLYFHDYWKAKITHNEFILIEARMQMIYSVTFIIKRALSYNFKIKCSF